MPDLSLRDRLIDQISRMIDECTDWQSQLMRRIFYPETATPGTILVAPQGLDDLAAAATGNRTVEANEIERLQRLYAEIQALADRLMAEARVGQAPLYDSFNDLSNMFDEVLHRLVRLERDQSLAGRGYDPLTGFRSGELMFDELDRELERVARRGRSFALVLARLDSVAPARDELGAGFSNVMKWLGTAVRLTLRTFDDVYMLPDDEFVISLKHTDSTGAQRFIHRLREQMALMPLTINEKDVKVNLSFCVGEPMVGESIQNFMELMRVDFTDQPNVAASDVVLYEEISPLQRFLGRGDEK